MLSQDTKTLQLLILNEKLEIIDVRNTSDPFSIFVPRKGESGSSLPEPTYVVPQIKWYEQMIYHQFLVEKADSAVNIEISLTNPSAELVIFLKYRHKPMYDYYDLLIPLNALNKSEDKNSYEIFLSNQLINNRTGFFYAGIIEVNKTIVSDPNQMYLFNEIIVNENASLMNYTFAESNYTFPGFNRDFTTNYSMRIFTSGCYFYDYHRKLWSAEGCSVETANQVSLIKLLINKLNKLIC